MTYEEVIDDITVKLPMFSKIGASAYKADLSNTLTLSALMQHPEKNLRCIHIAGTNGKGSTSNILASIFQEAGYKVGLFTSPHLKDFRERIRVNDKMISKRDVISYHRLMIAKATEIHASFFEVTTIMAFAYFVKEKVDIAIIEVGLGGRLDCTNIVNPDLSVITNISFDHQQFLGDTLPKITSEKAGIIKKNKPVVIGETHPETTPVFIEKAKTENTEIHFAKDAQHQVIFSENNNLMIDGQKVDCPLKTTYQLKNIQTVLTAIDIYRMHYPDMTVTNQNVSDGLKNVLTNTGFQGRWQQIRKSPKTIVDVGHNEDGIKNIIEQVQRETFKHLRIVYGVVNDKDIDHILQLLPKENVSYYLCEPHSARKLDITILQEKFQALHLNIASTHHLPQDAYKAALKDAASKDLILIVGSTFVVSEFV
ncbi:MAG: bifunctional folylpolyglutamate synthase/dihydrofolate synthase [Chitinophagales bacterium]|nr:bifunctional folylpolyglutamate synthase/dihydrofolate synthase [Chitinophagales bacterium]